MLLKTKGNDKKAKPREGRAKPMEQVSGAGSRVPGVGCQVSEGERPVASEPGFLSCPDLDEAK